MTLEIRKVDPHDRAAFDAWHAAYLAADQLGREYALPMRLEEMRADVQAVEKGRRAEAWAGVVDGEVVVSGLLEIQLLDNLSAAFMEVFTAPGRRRQGHGSAMLGHLESVARGHGRSILMVEASFPYPGPADGADAPVVSWLTARGYRLALVDLQQRLSLPVPEERLDALAAEAAPHHTAYRLRSWAGPVPDDIVESFTVLEASIATEAPLGDLHLEPEAADVEDLRDGEATLARQGRTKYNTVALDAAGEVVAYTDLVTSVHEEGRAFQWGTLVRRAERGHRLGLAVKAANLRQLQRARPDITELVTFNAEVNTHMLGVNERLGFAAVERLGEFQKRT